MAEKEELDPLALAIVALLIDERQSRVGDAGTKTEVLLHRCGVPIPVIAQVMNKQVDAVRKTISRAGAKKGKEPDG
jgi:hypothetical protein